MFPGLGLGEIERDDEAEVEGEIVVEELELGLELGLRPELGLELGLRPELGLELGLRPELGLELGLRPELGLELGLELALLLGAWGGTRNWGRSRLNDTTTSGVTGFEFNDPTLFDGDLKRKRFPRRS